MADEPMEEGEPYSYHVSLINVHFRHSLALLPYEGKKKKGIACYLSFKPVTLFDQI